MPALLLGLALHHAAFLGHIDLELQPCVPTDEQQKWTFVGKGLGFGGNIVHQSTKLCLMTLDCQDGVGTPLVLDGCKAGCVAAQPNAATFTLHHGGGSHPLGLENHLPDNTLFVASSGDPVLTLMAWDADSAPSHQQWTSVMPYQGPDHTLKVGDSPGLCLSAHHDVVPDGDSGENTPANPIQCDTLQRHFRTAASVSAGRI